jgi:DNA-binding MarR family transcriptional regulator
MRSPGERYPLDSVLDFLRLLWAVEHGLERRSKRMEASVGVTGPQRLVLRIVGRFPGLSAGDLAHILQLHPSTITGILQRLTSRGLIARDPDPEDKRRICLRLKPGARAFAKISQGTIEQAVTRALSRTRASQVRAAREVLSAVADALHALNEQDRRRGEKREDRRRP